MTGNVELDGDTVVLTMPRGVARMLVLGAQKDADLWARSNASSELKGHWGRRAAIIRSIADQIPAPVNPRDPYEDLPDEPTPDEAAAQHRERAATEEARIAARVAAAARRPVEETPVAPDLPGEIDETPVAPPIAYDDDDLLS